MQANYLHHQGGRLGVLLHRRQTFVTSNPSCDLKQGKYLADSQPSSGSDSSFAAGRIRRINRKKSVALKASVCVWYWLGHAPVDLHPHVLRNFSWGLPRGFCTSALISFAFVAEGGINSTQISSPRMHRETLVIQYNYRACSLLSGSALTKTLLEAEDHVTANNVKSLLLQLCCQSPAVFKLDPSSREDDGCLEPLFPCVVIT